MLTNKLLFFRGWPAMVAIALMACQAPTAPPPNSSEPVNSIRDSIVAAPVTDTIYSGTRDTVILLKNDEAFIRGHMKGNRSKINYQMPAWKGQVIMASLKTISNGRLCFYQVKEPGKDPIGPLGDSLQLKMDNSGNVLFSVGDIQGKGRGYSGDFVMHIALKQQQ